ncbi:MAG: tetratricopeptide repeat protein, partial [Planctomycetota bacterium]
VHGLNADICFQIAELLYRSGDVCGARERYFTALEIEPELLEARANLGCVLLECQQADLAIAAFEGALAQYPDYADVHFHLARALEELGEANRAVQHWQRFLDLAPTSPWAEEAQHRLNDHALEHIPLHFEDMDSGRRK